ncbi:hypothetical protein RJ639_045131 [Escallonia herrerae]|uniref:Prolamin-like domain-containing protein n=1 Tax=Escallonia herrerae TaxID=1293975 RepID=A0AA88WEU2_9ASTE|nr:hypothetical protein RJ639_045131 [Escallonia herrerae]
MTTIKLLLTLALSWLIFTVNATRGDGIKPGQNIAARLEGEGGGGITECWSALLELKSCTNEIILFFINGESYLGMGCCRAIRTITHHCWPSMLTSLGYTAEEGDILSDYCGGSAPPQPAVEEILQSPARLRI